MPPVHSQDSQTSAATARERDDVTFAAGSWSELASAYLPRVRTALTDSILPFWWRAIDEANGGVFNCWNNAGTHLVSRDKFTWSQGRFAWLWSRLADVAAQGLIPGEPDRFLVQAGKTVRFLERGAFLDDGRCAFLLSEDGALKEAIPGQGPAPSIYADCFVVMGLAEFARVSGESAVLERAWQLYESIEQRIVRGGFPAWPQSVPDGYDAYAIAMISMNVALVLADACAQRQDPRLAVAQARGVAAASRILERFMQPGGGIAELRRIDGGDDPSLLARHINPGHSLEGWWMVLTIAARTGRADWLRRAAAGTRFALERGWDATHGGLLYYVDYDGGPPAGVAGDSAHEAAVRRSWDTKLWWVHSEALYTTALCYRLTGDDTMRAWFERIWEYSFRTFPHPDPAIGEWIQIRDREGKPLERVVALPVKDPYHIARNLIQLLELFSGRSPHPTP